MRLIIIASLFVPALSFAGPADTAAPRVLETDFEAVQLRGEVVGPRFELISEPLRAGFRPLTTLRKHFEIEIRESVDIVK